MASAEIQVYVIKQINIKDISRISESGELIREIERDV